MMNPPLKSENRIEHPRTIGKETTDKYAYYGLAVYFRGPAFKPGGQSEKDMMASFLLEPEVAPLFPYLNAVAERAELHQNPGFIRFLFENRFCVLYPKAGLVTPVIDRPHARSFVERLIAFLNDTSSRRNGITPSHRLYQRVSVLNILKLLPKSNCGRCGYASCMAFAASLSLQESVPEKCPHVRSPMTEQAFYPVYDAAGNQVSTVMININTAKYRVPREQTHSAPNEDSKASPGTDARTADTADHSLFAPLTSREREVLCILSEGASNNEISRMLKISPHTVKSHVIHIFNKLGVNDRTQAAVWAARHHLI